MGRPRIHYTSETDFVEYKIRLTAMQARRIDRVSKFDMLPKVEHVRRAVDSYLDIVEPKYNLTDSPTPESPANPTPKA